MDGRPIADKFIGVKLTTADYARVRQAAQRVGSISDFVRAAIRRALDERSL